MRPRIDIIRTRYPHWGAYSGISQFLKHLDRDHFAIEQFVASDGDEDFPIQHPVISAWFRRVVQRKGMAWYKLSDVRAEVRALGRSLRGRLDIIHYLDGEHSAQYVPLARGNVRRASWPQLIATFHQPARVLPGLVRPDVVRNLDHVTVVAPTQVEFFGQFLPRERVHVILHGVDTTFFRPLAHRSRGGDFCCLTVGHYLRDFVAVRRVAELLAAERDVRFHIVTGFETGLEDLANVTVHRGLSDHALLSLYQTADVLFLPLLDCTANNALLEGLASGLPLVTTDLASVRAYAPGGAVICVRENDPDELAEAIRQLRSCPALRERMAQAARRRAEQLSWPEIARAYERLYNDALSAGRRYPS